MRSVAKALQAFLLGCNGTSGIGIAIDLFSREEGYALPHKTWDNENVLKETVIYTLVEK